MASKLWVSTFAEPPQYQGEMQPCVRPPAATQVVDFASGVTASSAAFGVDARIVLLHADSACHVAFGTSPTATTGDMRIAAGADRYIWVGDGTPATLKISAIAAA